MGEFCTRPEQLACYILDEKTTIRKTALAFGISKSTVHNDLSKRLKYINFSLYKKVKKLGKFFRSTCVYGKIAVTYTMREN